jgi:hypothetical protein
MKRTFVILLLLSVAAIGRSWPDEGRIPIFAPVVITQPGHYILTRDITAPTGANGIAIQSDNVTVDLNGHQVTGVAGLSLSAIGIADGARDITLRNGRILGGNVGITYSSGTVGTRLVIDSLDISRTSDRAIDIRGAEYIEVRSCRMVADSAGGSTLRVLAVSGTDTFIGRFVGNTILGAGKGNDAGMELEDLRAGQIRDNEVTTVQALGPGISVCDQAPTTPQDGGNIVEGNTVSGGPAGTNGMFFCTSHNLIVNDVVHQMPGLGLVLTSGTAGNIVADNVTGGDGNNGIHATLSSRNLIEGNLAEGNTGTGCGLYFGSSSANAYRSNMLRNNAGGAICLPAGNLDAGGNIL